MEDGRCAKYIILYKYRNYFIVIIIIIIIIIIIACDKTDSVHCRKDGTSICKNIQSI